MTCDSEVVEKPQELENYEKVNIEGIVPIHFGYMDSNN